MIRKNQSKYEGPILVNNKKINFVILEDNSCLITPDSVYKLFGKTKRIKKKELNTNKVSFLHTPFLKKIFDNQSKDILLPITYRDLKNNFNQGYAIELIHKIVAIYTNNEVDIPQSQTQLYNQCVLLKNEIIKKNLQLIIYRDLKCAFNKERKLIDEGILNYTKKTSRDWVHTIPIQFYLELFRLNNWKFNENEIKKRPSIIAKWVDALVLSLIEKQLTNSLKKPTPKALKKAALVHPISELNTNNKSLDIQIIKTITLMNISYSIREVWTYFEKSNQLEHNNIKSPFLFNEKGYTIEPIDDSFLSDFNLKLKTALGFNPSRKSRE